MRLVKELSITIVFFILASSFVLAATWHEKFVTNYEETGIDLAVEKAVKEDNKNPDQIIKIALPVIKEDERPVLIKALLCAGAKPEKVEAAAEKNKMNETTLSDGYQLALTECRRIMEENLNFIPPASGGGGTNASPWRWRVK